MSANSLPPSDLAVSFYLFKTCKLWVWDFDDTLINTDTYLRRNMKPSTIRNLTDCDLDIDFPQWRYFSKLVDFLITHGKYVAIASFGTYEIIRAYMDRVIGFNQKVFGKHNIIAPCLLDRDSRRFSVPPNKNEYIYQLMKIYRVQDFGRVVLFDDMPSNISSAISIGVIGVQIATPRNGDKDPKKMYFGPWIMVDLDNKLNTTCCDKLNNANDANSSKATLVNSEFFLGDNFEYTQSAFGTGIGDRRISKKPDNRWNKMNVENPPLWQNGNWQTNGGTMTYETTEKTSGLGGYSLNFWENEQSVIKKKIYGDRDRVRESDIDNNNSIEDFQSGGSGKNNKKDKFIDTENCQSCKKITWNWITLTLMVIIIMMVALCFSVM